MYWPDSVEQREHHSFCSAHFKAPWARTSNRCSAITCFLHCWRKECTKMDRILILHYSSPERKWPMPLPGRNKEEHPTNWSQQACDETGRVIQAQQRKGSWELDSIPSGAYWIWVASTRNTANRSQGLVKEASLWEEINMSRAMNYIKFWNFGRLTVCILPLT